jgi:hypothetical protein
MKRITWFVTGVAAGATGASYATKKVKERAQQLKPANVPRGAAAKVKGGGARVVEAIRDGRAAMQAKEDELRARRDHEVESVDERLEPGEQLLVDGEPVESGRVIVLKQRG